MTRGLVLLLAIVLLVAGCGGDEEATPTETDTDTVTTPVETRSVKVYWLRDGKLWAASRDVADPAEGDRTRAVATATLFQLLLGPTEQERADPGVDTAVVVTGMGQLWNLSIEDGTARVSAEPPPDLSREALAQLVYTVTQFPTIERVAVLGKTYTRADFEDLAPPA